jgi:hypothetical protein
MNQTEILADSVRDSACWSTAKPKPVIAVGWHFGSRRPSCARRRPLKSSTSARREDGAPQVVGRQQVAQSAAIGVRAERGIRAARGSGARPRGSTPDSRDTRGTSPTEKAQPPQII